jgi:hypothetical protein
MAAGKHAVCKIAKANADLTILLVGCILDNIIMTVRPLQYYRPRVISRSNWARKALFHLNGAIRRPAARIFKAVLATARN